MENEFKVNFKKKFSFLSDQVLDIIWNKVINLANKYNLDINESNIVVGGDASIVFLFNDFVIKAFSNGYDNMNYLSKSYYILKPVDEELEYCSYMGINLPISVILCPRLYTNNVTVNDVVKTVKSLLNDGYALLDIKLENFGKDLNGNVYLLDYGELFREDLDKDYLNNKKTCLLRLEKFIKINKKNHNLFGRKAR